MIALIDCNNFFVSCERVRDPQLNGIPVIVLSGGSGCVVAMSNEAKALGITRSAPYFKIKAMCEANGVVALHGSHRLYREISDKVMQVLREHATHGIEIYSIDDAFIVVNSDIGDPRDYGLYLVDTIFRRTGIPVSMGISATKTLAKLAARFAKRYPGYNGVCVIDTEEKLRKALSMSEARDIWGIGPNVARRLADVGVTTALGVYELPDNKARRLLHKGGYDTWRELHGMACIERRTPEPENRSISVTRTLPHDTFDLDELTRLITTYASAATVSLRKKGYLAREITVMLRTNRFHTSQIQYNPNLTVKLPEHTDYTPDICSAAVEALRSIYREGIGFKRAGITLHHFIAKEKATGNLFEDEATTDKRRRAMAVMDRMNTASGLQPAIMIASTVSNKKRDADAPK